MSNVSVRMEHITSSKHYKFQIDFFIVGHVLISNEKMFESTILFTYINPNLGTWGLVGPDACISIYHVGLIHPIISISYIFFINSVDFKGIAKQIFNVVLEKKWEHQKHKNDVEG